MQQFKVGKPPHLPVVNVPKNGTRPNPKRRKIRPQRIFPLIPLKTRQPQQKSDAKFPRQKPRLHKPPQLLKQIQKPRERKRPNKNANHYAHIRRQNILPNVLKSVGLYPLNDNLRQIVNVLSPLKRPKPRVRCPPNGLRLRNKPTPSDLQEVRRARLRRAAFQLVRVVPQQQ